MNYRPPPLTDLILATLLSAGSSKIFRDILREKDLQRRNYESIRVTLTRLEKKGYVKRLNSVWSLTNQGKYKARQIPLLDFLPSKFPSNSPKNTIVSFDIPEKKRTLRNWLRNQLKIFNYEMLQQSLWLGPGPLPAEFFERLNTLGIRKNIKTFGIKIK